MVEYYQKKIDVKGHKRYDPRSDKKVDVNSYKRNQNIRIYQKSSKKPIENYYSKNIAIIKEIEQLLKTGKIEDIKNLMTLDNFLGSGEFSDAYLISDNLILKVNRNESKFNPQFFADIDFTKISKKEMKSEINTYNKLKDNYSDILPKTMKGYEIGDKYLILRDYGEIHIDPKQYEEKRKELIQKYPKVDPKKFEVINIAYPKWKKGSISKREYDKFTKRLFDLGRDIGFFDDQLQIAKRKSNKSLFLVDLGHFKKKEMSGLYEYGIKASSQDQELKDTFNEIEKRLKHLDYQIGLKHNYPTFVIDFHIKFYKSLVEKRKKIGMNNIVKIYEESLNKWRNKKKTRQMKNVK